MSDEKSCGIIVYNPSTGKILIIRSKAEQLWGIPKGHVEVNETEEETASRELYEETGVKAKIISGFRETLTYRLHSGKSKTVVYFIAIPLNYDVKYILPEVDMHEWASFDGAIQKISFKDMHGVLRKAESFIIDNKSLFTSQ